MVASMFGVRLMASEKTLVREGLRSTGAGVVDESKSP